MRSEIALASLLTKNRFALCHQVFKIVRKLHKPGNRIQDTATDALQRLQAWSNNRVKRKARTLTKANQNRSRLRLNVGAPSAKPLAGIVAEFPRTKEKPTIQ